MKSISALLLAGMATTACSLMAADPESPKLPPPASQPGVTYEKDIQPILKASCFRCHGDSPRPSGGLRLDTLDLVIKGGRDGKDIIPGDSEKSPLVLRVARVNPRTAMPPPPRPRRGGPGGFGGPRGEGTNAPNAGASASPEVGATNQPPGGRPGGMGQEPPPAPLTAEQVGLIRAWVDQGAK